MESRAVIPFEATFSSTAPLTPEEQELIKTFPLDSSLDQKLPQLAEALAWMLLECMSEPRCEDPDEVLFATEEYQKSNDILLAFMEIHIEKDENAVAMRFDFNDMFKEFCRDNCSQKRALTFMEFIKGMTKKLGPPSISNGEGWQGYLIKSAQKGTSTGPQQPEHVRDLL